MLMKQVPQMQMMHSGGCETSTEPEGEACRTSRLEVGDEVRWVEGFQELDCPPVPFPSRRVFAAAGERLIRALVRRHHERLRVSAVAALFPTEPAAFSALVERSADYFVEACGGSAYFTSSQGKPCMRGRHFPFTIDERAREVWLEQLWLAFDDVDFPAAVRREFWDWVEPFSIRMINRRTHRTQPRRFAFDAVAATLLLQATQAPREARRRLSGP